MKYSIISIVLFHNILLLCIAGYAIAIYSKSLLTINEGFENG